MREGASLVEAIVDVVLRFGCGENEGQVEGVNDDGSEVAVPLACVDCRRLRMIERQRGGATTHEGGYKGQGRARID
jgi:hypothetical protein